MQMETFDQATAWLAEELKKIGRPPNIVWIVRENVSQIKTLTFFHVGNKSQNEVVAKMVYNRGVGKGLGIALRSQFYTQNYSVAYVWHPKYEIDAIEHLQGKGLSLRIAEKGADPRIFKEIEIKNKLVWKLLKWLEDENSPYKSILIDMPRSDGSIEDWNEGKSDRKFLRRKNERKE